MNTIQTNLERARNQARDLHKKLAVTAIVDQVALRAEMAHAAAKALELRHSLSAKANGERPGAQKHIEAAKAALDDAASRAKAAATAGAADLKSAAEAARERTRQAVQQLTDAVALQRSRADI